MPAMEGALENPTRRTGMQDLLSGRQEDVVPNQGGGRRQSIREEGSSHRSSKDRVESDDNNAQLALSGSRSQFAKLRPKLRTDKPPEQRMRRGVSDLSSANLSAAGGLEDASSVTSGERTAIDDPIEKNRKVSQKASAFRSMLTRGGGTTPAAAMLFKKKIGRLPARGSRRSGDHEPAVLPKSRKALSGGWSRDIKRRPPVQHSGSLTSDEEDSSASGEGRIDGTGEHHSQPSSPSRAHASQLQQRLRDLAPSARKFPWSTRNSDRNGGSSAIHERRRWLPNARVPESPSSVLSGSNSTASGNVEEDIDRSDGRLNSSADSKGTPPEPGARSRIDEKPRVGQGDRRGRFLRRRGAPLEAVEADTARVLDSSRGRGRTLRDHWATLLWRSREWGVLRESNERSARPVIGVGMPPAGDLENALYRCLSGVVARPWPGLGLALRPVDEGEDGHEINLLKGQTDFGHDVIRIHVLGTDPLPEDSRITRPMVVVHIVDSSTGCHLSKSMSAEVRGDSFISRDSNAREAERHGQNGGREDNDESLAGSPTRGRRNDRAWKGPSGLERASPGPRGVEITAPRGGATTTFEERTVWSVDDSTGRETQAARRYERVPPVATKPWIMTMRSSTPLWNEAFVIAESFDRLLHPHALVLFELVDFAAALPRGQARKGRGLSKIAWAFFRPAGSGGECNVHARGADEETPSITAVPAEITHLHHGTPGKDSKRHTSRLANLQLFEYRPLSALVRWQARRRGFPRLAPPASPGVPDVFLQFLLFRRHRYEALAHMREKARELAEGDDQSVAESNRAGGHGANEATGYKERVDRAWAARARRLRGRNDQCVLPNRLLHRVFAGQNGAITLAFSSTGVLLAAACCDDPLPGCFPIRLIDVETGRCRHELRGHASIVYSLAWSPEDSLLLSASADGTAKVWHVGPGNRLGDSLEGGVPYTDAGLTNPEAVRTAARRDGTEADPRLMCVLQHVPPCFVYAAVFQPAVLDITRGATTAPEKQTKSDASECALVVTGAYDRRLRLWDVSSLSVAQGCWGKMLGTLSNKVVHESHVNAIVYDAKNGRLYSGDGVGAVVVWRRGAGARQGVDDYSVLRKVQHADLVGKAITSLALAPRLRRGQLLVQAHGNTLRLLDLGTYQLVNPGYAGGAASGSLIRANFSPDGRFVVSGSERGQVRIWDAQEGNRIRSPLQTLGTACCLRDVAWHPRQHVLALAGYGADAPVLLYYGETKADKYAKASQSALEREEAAREMQASAEEHRRRLENRQRLRELRVKRLRAKALGFVEGAKEDDGRPEQGVVAALTALTAESKKAMAEPGEHAGAISDVALAASVEREKTKSYV